MVLSDEESKAIQEVAKAATKYEPAFRSLGEFIGRVIGYPLDQAGGYVGDKIAFRRLENSLSFQKRVEVLFGERGIKEIRRTIPLNVAYPLLEAASLEEDGSLSEMFANLLVNAIDENYDGYIPKSFVETLKRMSPFEAIILKKMSEAPEMALADSGMMYTSGLPDDFPDGPKPRDREYGQPSPQVTLALASLVSAGCIQGIMMMNGANVLSQARVTEYGRELMKACLPK